MSSEYEISKNGNDRFLVAIVCDDCGAKIKSYPSIFKYGWIMKGCGKGKDFTVKEYCPNCIKEEKNV